MVVKDPLTRLMQLDGVAPSADAARAAIAAAHRRPASLRKPELISSESLLRGARLLSPGMEAAPGAEISAYSLLAPELLTTTVRSFARAPLGVMAKADLAAGGPGTPAPGQAPRAQALAALIARGAGVDFDVLAPAVVQAEIAAHEMFGPTSEVVARVAARATAVHTGLDPRCLAVPETYLNRRAANYRAGLAAYKRGDPQPLLVILLRAWEAGGVEADAIARAV